MVGALLKGGIAGGVLVFFWGAFSWMVLPWHNATLLKFQDEAAVTQVVESATLGSGIYVLPNSHSGTGSLSAEERAAVMSEAQERMKRGPLVFMSVMREGADPEMKSQLLSNLIVNVLAAALFTWLLLQASIANYWRRVVFVVVAALTAGLICHMPHWIWWGFSNSYTAVAIADLMVTWFLAGLLMARFAK